MQITQYPSFQNDSVSLTESFLGGEYFNSKLLEKVFSTFDAVDNTDADEDKTYAKQFPLAKEMLRKYKPSKLTKDIFHIPCGQAVKVPHLTKVALVRYINLCHKAKFVIVLGDEVLFQPAHLSHVPPKNLDLFIQLNISEAQKRTTNSFLNRIRAWTHGFKFMILRTTHA